MMVVPKTWKVFSRCDFGGHFADKTPDCWQLQPDTRVNVLTSYGPPNGAPRLRSGNGCILKNSATEHL
jgi:hypothetical protein